MCIRGSTPAMLGVPPFRIHTFVEPVRWWKETDKKQESEKDAGIRNAVQSHGAWRARVGVTGEGGPPRSAAPSRAPQVSLECRPQMELQKSGGDLTVGGHSGQRGP